jgi:hypothetical protein
MGAEVRPLHTSLQGSQLVAEGQILEDHVVVATAGDADRPQEQQCEFKHVLILSGVAAESNTRKAATTFWRTPGAFASLCLEKRLRRRVQSARILSDSRPHALTKNRRENDN